MKIFSIFNVTYYLFRNLGWHLCISRYYGNALRGTHPLIYLQPKTIDFDLAKVWKELINRTEIVWETKYFKVQTDFVMTFISPPSLCSVSVILVAVSSLLLYHPFMTFSFDENLSFLPKVCLKFRNFKFYFFHMFMFNLLTSNTPIT